MRLQFRLDDWETAVGSFMMMFGKCVRLFPSQHLARLMAGGHNCPAAFRCGEGGERHYERQRLVAEEGQRRNWRTSGPRGRSLHR